MHLSSILAITLFVLLTIGSDGGEDTTVNLNAQVSFDGSQFVIVNKDNFDYRNVKLELNDKYILKGYTLRTGESYTVGMMQFADKDGNRFSIMQKPQKFTIWCDLAGDKNGFYYATWN